MTVEKYIPNGRANAVSRTALCMRTGRTDRENRRGIKEARDRGIPIVASPDDGYYITDDPAEIKRLQNDYRHRAIQMLNTARRLNKAHRDDFKSEPEQEEP